MKHFVNEYKYTTDIISESMAVFWMRYFRNGYKSMGIFILLILCLALFRMQLIYLLLEPLPILMIVLFKVKEKRSVKLEQERMKVIYKDAVPSIRIEIGEDIHCLSDKRESSVSFSDVEDMVETDHLIVLFIRGSMTMVLDKEGFLSGTADECIKYLKEHI